MRVTATFIVLAQDAARGVSWKARLGARGLLEYGVEQALSIPLVDELVVLTDIDELLSKDTVAGSPVGEIWPWSVRERMDFLTCDWTLIYQQTLALEKAGLDGDVHFFLDWRLPLLSPLSWERMYHALLEDRLASRIVPIHPEDPNLFMPLNGGIASGGLFGVWAHSGRDRQKVPQLYRSFGACVAHRHRLMYPEPLTKGFDVPLAQCVQVRRPVDLELAEFLLTRAGRIRPEAQGDPEQNLENTKRATWPRQEKELIMERLRNLDCNVTELTP